MKLISLNLEGAKHLAHALPFLEKESADVVCLQELFEKDGHAIAKQLGMSFSFAPMTLKKYNVGDSGAYETFGVGILSKELMQNTKSTPYWSPGEALQKFDNATIHTKRATERHVLLSTDISFQGNRYSVATTHFTWTPDGVADAYQAEDADTLLHILSSFSQIIFCGDLNIPRHFNTLYEKFASEFVDAIPPSFTSSIDLSLHRLGADATQAPRLATFMVDYLFLRGYTARDVHLEAGVSDHMAIVGTISAV